MSGPAHCYFLPTKYPVDMARIFTHHSPREHIDSPDFHPQRSQKCLLGITISYLSIDQSILSPFLYSTIIYSVALRNIHQGLFLRCTNMAN